MKSIICPSCGATDVAVDNGVIYCSYCGTNSILPVKKRRKKEATQELPSKVIIRKNLDEGSAIRDAYIFLATHKNTPGDLFNDFKLTSMSSYWHFVEGMCEFSTTITCSVGYEKKETKNVREKYYDYQAKKTKTHWVTKEFTTIDWKPFSSPFSRSYPIEIEIDTYNDTLAGFFSNYIKGTSDSMRIPFVEESENEDEPRSPNETQLRQKCDALVATFKKELLSSIPGDKVKDLTDPEVTVHGKIIKSYSIPVYKISYNYKNRPYALIEIADKSASTRFISEAPGNDEKNSKLLEIKKTIKKEKIIWFSLTGVSVALALASAFGLFSSVFHNEIITFILFHLIGLVFLGLGFIRTKMGWKKYANTEQNFDAIALDEKKKQLKNIFSNLGIEYPTDREFEDIS